METDNSAADAKRPRPGVLDDVRTAAVQPAEHLDRDAMVVAQARAHLAQVLAAEAEQDRRLSPGGQRRDPRADAGRLATPDPDLGERAHPASRRTRQGRKQRPELDGVLMARKRQPDTGMDQH